LTYACRKDEGIGGGATIKGKVYSVHFSDKYYYTIDTLAAMDEDVYIVYGDNTFYDDNIKTHYDGTFEFKYLRKGKYSVYVYSNDTNNFGNKIPIIKTIEITDNKQTYKVDDIYIYKGISGASSITGIVIVIDYYDANNQPKKPPYIRYTAPEEDVYIMYENKPYFFERTRTGYDGVFYFGGLVTGRYYVYAYSKDPLAASEVKAIIDTIDITSLHQNITDTLYIYK